MPQTTEIQDYENGPNITLMHPPKTRADKGVGMGGPAVVLFAAVMTQLMTAPGQTVGISVFVNHLIGDLGLSRSQVSTAYLIGTAAGALTLPFMGRFIDRRGVGRATIVFGAFFGGALAAMAGVAGFWTLAIGFAATRMLGQGALTLTATTSVAVAFDRNRGTAMGLKSALGGATMSLVPLLAAVGIAAWGWRWTYLALGAMTWVVLLPLGRMMSDPLPGLRLDSAAGRSEPRRKIQLEPVVRDVLRHPAFWVVTSIVALAALVSTGLVFHQISLLTQRGLTPAQAAANFVPQAIAAAVAALAGGRLADRLSARVVMVLSACLVTAAPVLVQVAAPGPLAVLYAIVLGAGGSCVRPVEAALLPRWFGIASIGELRGLVLSVAVTASAIGPLIMATAHDVLGAYRPALQGFLALGCVVTLAAVLIRPPGMAEPLSAGAGSGPTANRD